MHETSKSTAHRMHDSRYATRYFVGDGIDIGSGPDSLSQYSEFFPLMRSCAAWDLPQGDAELMESVPDNSFDFVHSSHCLEHMRDMQRALNNWLRILKPDGHLVCTIPDEDLYEQGVFPSLFNTDHKHTLTIFKKRSWSPESVNVMDLLRNVPCTIAIKKIELLDSTYRYHLRTPQKIDQTNTPIGEASIEFIVKKLSVY